VFFSEQHSNKPTKEEHMKKTKEPEFFSTEEFSKKLHVKPETARRGLCMNGHYIVIPKKLSNGRLLWPADTTLQVLET
jgi:hypothetical protein